MPDLSAQPQDTGTSAPKPFRPVDVHVGSRVRLRRVMLGLSQTALGDAVGLTFQQIQKYERGANRISASRLFELSKILDVPISFFFDDMLATVAETYGRRELDDSKKERVEIEPDPAIKRETLELVRAYYSIPNATVRKRVQGLIKALAQDGTNEHSVDGEGSI